MVGRAFERSSVQADALSEREREVLRAASSGLTNAQMANVLGVTVHTVKFHLASIYRKLGATNRTDAIVRAIRAGITPDPRGDSAP